MRTEAYDLNIAPTPGPGAPFPLRDVWKATVSIDGLTGGTLLLEGASATGQFYTIGDPITEDGSVTIADLPELLRVDTTNAQGTVSARINVAKDRV